jgi:hypothetical protein
MAARRRQWFGQAFEKKETMEVSPVGFVHFHKIAILWSFKSRNSLEMNMYKILFFTTFFVLTILAIGCGGPPATNTNTNAPVNANRGNGNNVAVLNPTPKPVAPTENDAPTLGPVVRTYYDALKKKDDALLRTVLSQSMLKQLEADMKSEKKTGLAAYAAELDRVPEKDIEVRNEKINGDKATAELKGGAYVNWSSLSFVKEDGKWKMSNESAEIQAVKPTAPAPNTGK